MNLSMDLRTDTVKFRKEDANKPDGGGEQGDGNEGLHAAEVESMRMREGSRMLGPRTRPHLYT